MDISFHLTGNDELLALAVDGQIVSGSKLNRVCGLLNEVVSVLTSTPPAAREIPPEFTTYWRGVVSGTTLPPSFEPGFDPSEIGPYLVGQVSLKARSSALHDVEIEQPAIVRINVNRPPEQRLVLGKDLGDGGKPIQLVFELQSWLSGVATYSASLFDEPIEIQRGAECKLLVNRERQWNVPTGKDEPIEHVRRCPHRTPELGTIHADGGHPEHVPAPAA